MTPSMPQLLIVLAIVIVIFGGKRITGVVHGLGDSIKGFRKAIKEEDAQ